MQHFFIISIILLSVQGLFAQVVTVDSISIEGNKKTRYSTIVRELNFSEGDTISFENLSRRIEKNRTLLLNTRLFVTVDINIKSWDENTNFIHVQIIVKEQWYIFPVPIFELADRNFNVWWRDFNHSFRRVNYGLHLVLPNFTGRRDLLKSNIQFGFTQKYELEYTYPALNKAQTLGGSLNLYHTRNKDVGYTTLDNELLFLRDQDNQLLRQYRVLLGFSYRPGLYSKQNLTLGYYYRRINPTISTINPNFFLGGSSVQQFYMAKYSYSLDRRDKSAYAQNGYYVEAEVTKEGFGIHDDVNRLYFVNTLEQYFPLGKKEKISLAFKAKGRIQAIRGKPSYINNQALGYFEDYLRGYEYYVIDGMDYAYLKSSIRYQVMSTHVNWDKAMPLKAFKYMPLELYFTLNHDMGYVHDPYYYQENPLANTFLQSTSIGVDVVLFVDKVVRLDYSINARKEHGFFLHLQFLL